MELDLQPVDIKNLVESSMRLIKPQLMKKNLRVHTSLDGDLGSIALDGRRIIQMLINLLGNAVKFTPEGGSIGLEVTRENEGEAIRFTVWDTGIGIPQDRINQLFKPFMQIDSSLSRLYTGTGLGLALVNRLAQLHGGSVGVESEEGKGSRFWFILPVIQVVDSEAAQPGVVQPLVVQPGEADAAPQQVQAPRCALVIEDSLLAADQLSGYLREMNTEVVVHPRGKDAVQAAIAANPDVILLDLILPDTSGWQVLVQLKTNPQTREIPVVIVTVVDERKRGMNAGAVEYLVKPVTREQLNAAILKAVSPARQANRVLVIRHEQPAEQPSAQAGPAPFPAEPAPLIVIAEDNLVNLESYMDYLKAKGFRVIPAINGFEALARVEEFRPNLILMDIQMPGMDGLETIRRLRANPEFAKTPIIALTALAMPGDRERCLEAGASAYLAKPVGYRLLLKEINTALASRPA
jgi:CheY-like chemotaxis protein